MLGNLVNSSSNAMGIAGSELCGVGLTNRESNAQDAETVAKCNRPDGAVGTEDDEAEEEKSEYGQWNNETQVQFLRWFGWRETPNWRRVAGGWRRPHICAAKFRKLVPSFKLA